MIYKFFGKKSAGSGVNIHENKKIKQNYQLAEEFYKQIIKRLKKRTVYSGFKDIIWGAYLADMQLTRKFNKGFTFFLCVMDIFSKYAWVVPLKDKKGVSIVLDDSNKNQTKYGLTKEGNFAIVLLKNGWKIMILKCIRNITK